MVRCGCDQPLAIAQSVDVKREVSYNERQAFKHTEYGRLAETD